jgi:hypothetical protein
MRRRLFLVVVITAMWLAGVVAHDGHAHLVMGTITATDAKHIELRTPSGENLSIAVNAKTIVTRNKQKVGLSEVQKGGRAVVDIGNGEDPLIAREIRVGATRIAEK